MIKKALILVGGKGLRLRPYTDDIPKAMVKIDGKPLLYWILKWLEYHKITEIVLGVAYKKEIICDYIKDNTDFKDLNIVCNDHTEAEGTGDAFRLAIENQKIDDNHFIAMNGDELTDLSIHNFFKFHLDHDSIVTMLACPLTSPYGVLEIDDNHFITSFKEKKRLDNTFVNSGIYIFSKEIKKYLPEKGDIERTTFEELSKLRKLKAFKYNGFWRTVNTEKDLIILKNAINDLKFK